MKIKMWIQWINELEDDGIPPKNICSDCLTDDNADVFIGEGQTEDECLYKIYSQLFYANWTAFDSVSRQEIINT
jgi:hypothetical protein